MIPEQIKQTVAEIRAQYNKRVRSPRLSELGFFLEITDHLQKTIEAQAAEINRLKIALHEPSIPCEVI